MARPNVRLTKSILRTLRQYKSVDISLLVDLSIADGCFKLVKDATPAVKRELVRLESRGRLVVFTNARIVFTSR
jgi:hypothetical protein